jgi:CheY-like chemotaxis protein
MSNAATPRDDAFSGMVGAIIPNVVVVDPHFERYKPLAASARLGKLNLHFRSSGTDALRLARQRRVDAWLVAVELDDMSGHDFLELLQGRLEGAKAAIVQSGEVQGRERDVAVREASEIGADSLLSTPITFRDLERLLGQVGSGQAAIEPSFRTSRAFVTLPVGVGAAVVAIAVLMMG